MTALPFSEMSVPLIAAQSKLFGQKISDLANPHRRFLVSAVGGSIGVLGLRSEGRAARVGLVAENLFAAARSDDIARSGNRQGVVDPGPEIDARGAGPDLFDGHCACREI